MSEIKFCQSCGMPLDSDEVIGTNLNGTANDDYCVYCFEKGSFTEDITMDKMIDMSMAHMKEMFKGSPNFNENAALNNMKSFFPRLKRWKE